MLYHAMSMLYQSITSLFQNVTSVVYAQKGGTFFGCSRKVLTTRNDLALSLSLSFKNNISTDDRIENFNIDDLRRINRQDVIR